MNTKPCTVQTAPLLASLRYAACAAAGGGLHECQSSTMFTHFTVHNAYAPALSQLKQRRSRSAAPKQLLLKSHRLARKDAQLVHGSAKQPKHIDRLSMPVMLVQLKHSAQG